jgi:hypothetical protein
MHVIQRPKFIIKIGEESFFWINQFISRKQNFISLNLKEKSMRYDFFFFYLALKYKCPVKNILAGSPVRRDLIPASKG